MVPVRMEKPSKPEFWVLFPRLLPSFFPFNSTKWPRMCHESLENVQLGVSPGSVSMGSRSGILSLHWKAQYGKVAWKMSSSASYLGAWRWRRWSTSGVWLGELSHTCSRWSEKFKRSPRRFEKRSKNRFLGEIFIKNMYKQAQLPTVFFPFFPWETLNNIWEIANKQRNAAIRGGGGGEGWFSVGVILGFAVVGLRSVYFRFY